MMILAAGLSFATGFLLLRLFFRGLTVHPLLFFPLAAGIGAGWSAVLTFCNILAGPGLSAAPLWTMNTALIMALALRLRRSPSADKDFSWLTPWDPWDTAAILILFIMAIIITQLSGLAPYGLWDGWAVWNMKTQFLLNGKEQWAEVFRLHWHTQPDYPLLLPCINTWLASLSPEKWGMAARAAGVGYTLLTSMLLYGGLRQLSQPRAALLAMGLLIIFPKFIRIGTSQYADVQLAFYLLAAMVLLFLFLKEHHPGTAVLCGMSLGFLSFTKNEGIVMAGLLILLGAIHSFNRASSRAPRRVIIAGLLLGSLLTATPTIIEKFTLAPPNRDIFLSNLGQGFPYLNVHGLTLVIFKTVSVMWDPEYSFVWVLFLFMFVMQTKRYFFKEAKVLLAFYLLYAAAVVLVYLTTTHFDLAWRLSRTVERLLLCQLPGMILFHFFVYWPRHREQNVQDPA